VVSLVTQAPGGTVEINGVAHVVLRATRFEACVRFYDRLMPELGLQAVQRDDDSVYYVGGRTAVGIRRVDPEYADDPDVEGGAGLDHLCFRARGRQDVDELHRLLESIGADVVRPPREGPWAPGYYSLSFRDPEGIRLEVNHVPGKGLLADDASFDPAPDHPLTGTPDPGTTKA
jgi:catechol 2,3-dioxygenase-like lactoylglutathione lyase family enzyme